MEAPKNVVRVCGSSWSECGYCRGARAHIVNRPPTDSSKVYNVLAATLTPSTYERLVQRSWRRSGTNIYRPHNDVSCCPNLSIRLPVSEFKPSKSQRKVRRSMQKLLRVSACAINETGDTATPTRRNADYNFRRKDSITRESGILEYLSGLVHEILVPLVRGTRHIDKQLNPTAIPFRLKQQKKSSSHILASTSICARLAGLSKGSCDRAKLGKALAEELRERLINGNGAGIPPPKKKQLRTSFDSMIVSVTDVECHAESGQVIVHLKIGDEGLRTLSTDSCSGDFSTKDVHGDQGRSRDKLKYWFKREYPLVELGLPPYRITVQTLTAHNSALLPEVHQLYFDYQHSVHGDPHPLRDEIDHIDLEWSSGNEEWRTLATTMLHQQYGHLPVNRQQAIVASFGTFFDFLVDNPFPRASAQGTFHQHYRIGGVLLAVGVVDILPEGLSSVYLFYSPTFAHELVPLGKLASLMEIDYTASQNLKYYYLGYYIESCRKMRYKAEYRPSELLCPVTFRWLDAGVAQERLIIVSPRHHYGRLHIDSESEENDKNGEAVRRAMNEIRMYVGIETSLVTLEMLREAGQDIVSPFLYDFVQYVSPKVAGEFVVDFR